MNNGKVSIVIPTKNEEGNIPILVDRIFKVGLSDAEVIVVDDSTDNTAQVARGLGCKVIKGKGVGLGQAIIDGILASLNRVVVVMDADLSHRPESIPSLVNPIIEQGYDLVIGSRYVKCGEVINWGFSRVLISRVAGLLAFPITRLRDSTSGFFAFRKDVLKSVKLEASSWKIMLEILLKARPTRILEVPISFAPRYSGKSKLTYKQIVAYFTHIILLAFYKYQKFIKFSIVGGIGAVITFGLTWLLTEIFGLWYMLSLTIAAVTALCSNYTLNCLWTFKIAKNTDDADYEWDSFYNGSIIQRWWKQRIAKTIWGWIPNASKLLDVGCGSSPIITHYPDALGIDVNSKKLEYLQERCPYIKTQKAQTGLFLLESVKNQFDYVLCIEVLEHIKHPEYTMAAVSDLLKENGKLVVATPDYNRPLWHLAERFTPYKEKHITHFTRRSLEELCANFNLIPVKHKYIATCDLMEMFEKRGV